MRILFLLFFFLVMSVSGQDLLMRRAAEAYYQSDFQEAFDTYNQIDQKDSTIFFNMAQCAYYQKHYPEAIVFWREAQKNTCQSLYKKAKWAIEQMREASSKKAHFEAPGTLASFSRYTLSINLFWLQIIFFIAWMSLIMWFLYGKKTILKALFGILIVTGLAFICYDNYRAKNSPRAVVCIEHATIRMGPGHEYPVVTQIDYLDELVILDKRDEWYKVMGISGYGWIGASEVVTVESSMKKSSATEMTML